jgi:hypothetical protein
MRILRTEVYFEPTEIKWLYPELIHGNPGIAFAFIAINAEGIDLNEVFTPFASWPRVARSRVSEYEVRRFLDEALQFSAVGHREVLPFAVLDPDDTFEPPVPPNEAIINFIIEQNVVVENSPAEGIPFATLLKGASAATIGTYVGVQAAEGHTLLLLTVPAGIIVVGSAIAVSKAFEQSIHKVVERLTRPTKENVTTTPKPRR